MTHGYSLRSNAKGRRGRQSTDNPDGQAEGSSDNTVCSTGEAHDLTDDPGPATPKAAAHNTPVPAQNSEHQRTEEDERRTRGLGSSSIVGNTTHVNLDRFATRSQLETWEDIRKGRKRVEERRCAEAGRIRREQTVRGYEGEMRALRARIVALRWECEEEVARVQEKWARAHGVELGEVAVVNDGGEVMEDWDWEADGEMEVENDYPHSEASLTIDNDQDGLWQQQPRWPPQSPPSWSRRSETHFPPPLQTGSQRTQEQPPHIGETFSSSAMAGPSRLEPEVMEEESGQAHRLPQQSQGREPQSRPQPQPLRRQRAQLMVIPTSTTGALDPENSFRGTHGDKDSEMGE